MNLKSVALGCALAYAELGVGEEGGDNAGPEIRRFLSNIDPPISTAAPWCAAAIQYWSDLAARRLTVPNPLDIVRLEAYVQSYHDGLRHLVVGASEAEPGDLALFSFGGERWDHIGFVVVPPAIGTSIFTTVEGNTSADNQRDGDAVAVKARHLSGEYNVEFINWTPEQDAS